MKIARILPDTDLARFALLSRDNKREELRNFSLGAPRHSWAPFRAALPAIHNARKSLFGLPPCSWADVEDAIKRGCKAHPEWLEANIELAKLFHDYNQKLNLIAVEQEFYKVPIGFGAYMKLWNDFYTIEDDVPVVSFIDPRRRHGLNELGRKFVFSAMYHNLAIGDFEEARFEVFRFPMEGDQKARAIQRYRWNQKDLVEIDALNKAVQETYELWFEILDERELAARRNHSKRAEGGGLF